jgi:hypothetical protein
LDAYESVKVDRHNGTRKVSRMPFKNLETTCEKPFSFLIFHLEKDVECVFC